MQLVTNLIAVGTGVFAISAVLHGITIRLINKNNNSDLSSDVASHFSDCSTIECEEHLECIKELGKYPTCTCTSGFVTLARETEEGSEEVCHKICEKTTDCRPDELCKEDNELGTFCVASMDLDACDDSIRCEDPEACDLVNSHPQCMCPSNTLLIETETSGTIKWRCLKICESSTECEMGDVCKDLGSGIVCIASADLDTCDGIRCEAPFGCELLNSHPQCKCPSNELLVETDGTSERRCRKRCSTTADCKAGTLCFKDSILTQLYCEDRDRTAQCSDAVKCTSDTECRPTIDRKPECLCRNGYTEIEEGGFKATTRTCHEQTCTDSSCCQEFELCYQNETSKELYCNDRSKGCDGAACPSNEECLDALKGYSECKCFKGYRKISDTSGKMTCAVAGCTNELDCVDLENETACLKDDLTKQGRCIDPKDVKSCDHLICSNNLVCQEEYNWLCGCVQPENNDIGGCYRRCNIDEDCSSRGLGECINYTNLCSIQPVRP